MTIKKTLKMAFLAAALNIATAASSFAQHLTAIGVANIMNQLSREKTRSQRMAKDYLLAKIGIDPEKNKQNLKDNIDLFETTFDKILAGDEAAQLPAPPNTAIRHRLEQIRLLWNNYKMALTTDNADSIGQITTFGDRVLRELDRTMDQYDSAAEQAGFQDVAMVVRTAGRQRLLSQKMMKDICLIAMKVDVDQTLSDLRDSEAMFEQSHKDLINGNRSIPLPKTTNRKILDQMKMVYNDWKKFKIVVDEVAAKQGAHRPLVANAYEVNLKFFADLDKAVTLYAAQAEH